MRVTITVHGHLRHTSSVGNDELTVNLPDAGSLRIRDLLATLNILEEEIKDVQLNGRHARMDSTLRGRVRLEFFPRDR
jgi:hypothetical protein